MVECVKWPLNRDLFRKSEVSKPLEKCESPDMAFQRFAKLYRVSHSFPDPLEAFFVWKLSFQSRWKTDHQSAAKQKAPFSISFYHVT